MTITRRQWLDEFALALGVAAPTESEVDSLLTLAGVAAHTSERTTAPIACWLAARASMPLADVIAVADHLRNMPSDTTE